MLGRRGDSMLSSGNPSFTVAPGGTLIPVCLADSSHKVVNSRKGAGVSGCPIAHHAACILLKRAVAWHVFFVLLPFLCYFFSSDQARLVPQHPLNCRAGLRRPSFCIFSIMITPTQSAEPDVIQELIYATLKLTVPEVP